MNSPSCLSNLMVVGLVLALSQELTAQSTAIVVPGGASASTNSASGPDLIAGETVPVSLSPMMRKMEAILAVPQPGIDDQPVTVQRLLAELYDLGLHVQLDQSALDDAVSSDELITMPWPDARLFERLEQGLSQLNACLQLFEGHARILSKDVVDDQEYFITLTYDVSGLASTSSLPQLTGLIQSLVDLGSWSDSGDGDQTMIPFQVRARTLLTISAPWAGHLRVRRLLAQLTTMGDVSVVQGNMRARANLLTGSEIVGGSQPVQLPASTAQRQQWERFDPVDPAEARGLGGGAFSVRSR